MTTKQAHRLWLHYFYQITVNTKKGRNWSMVEISPCQYIGNIGALEKVTNGEREMRNQIGKRLQKRNKRKVKNFYCRKQKPDARLDKRQQNC